MSFLWHYFFMPIYDPEAPNALVDMDGVLAGFDYEVERQLALHHPDIVIPPQRTNFYISADYPDHLELVRGISDQEGFFAELPLIEGAIEGWHRIMACGFTPRICSSPISTNPYCEAEKLDWLKRHLVPEFGSWVIEQAIITKEKEKVDGVALFDDRPEVANAEDARWQHIVFDQPYNRHIALPRLRGWLDPNLPQLLWAAQLRYSMR
jgi:5'-nucleotidase